MNERIRVREVRLIDANGDQLGVVATDAAMARAREQGLDLVEVAEKSRPPVCKIMDYGKYKYELKLKQRQNAKKQHKVVLKEVRMRPKTGEHDYQVKLRNAKRFLEKGYKVQVNVLFRGRERAHTEIARGHLNRMVEELDDLAKVEVNPKMEGYRMIMVMAPTAKAFEIAKAKEREKEEKKKKGKKGRKSSSQRGKKVSGSEAELDAVSEDAVSEDEVDPVSEDASEE